MNFNPYLTTGPATRACEHPSASASRLDGEAVASAWECDDCGDLRMFNDADHAFVNACPWRSPEQRFLTRFYR